MVYTLRFFSSKCSLFHNSNIFGSCIIHILYTGCAKIKKIIPAPKDLCSPNAVHIAVGKAGNRRVRKCVHGKGVSSSPRNCAISYENSSRILIMLPLIFTVFKEFKILRKLVRPPVVDVFG